MKQSLVVLNIHNKLGDIYLYHSIIESCNEPKTFLTTMVVFQNVIPIYFVILDKKNKFQIILHNLLTFLMW